MRLPLDNMRRAFTLVELLVVIAIIGLLSSVAVFSTSSSREKARIAAGLSFEQSLQNALGSSSVASYDLQEGSGATAGDSSGNGLNASITGSPAWSTDVPGGSAKYSLTFTNNEYLTPSRGMGFANTNFTIALWMKTTLNNGQMYIIANSGGASGLMYGLSNGRIGFWIGNGTVSIETTCGSKTVNDGRWHHVVGSWSRTTQSFHCYLDGAKIGSVALPSYIPNIGDTPLQIGKPVCCGANVYAGQLTGIRFYSADVSGVSLAPTSRFDDLAERPPADRPLPML